MRKSLLLVSLLVLAMTLLLVGCEKEETATPEPTQPAGEQPQPTTPPPTEEEVQPVEIRWFIGLGTGTNPEHQPVQNLFVDYFNASHPNIVLSIEVVPNDVAFDTLKTEIAGGDPPDVVGPVGVRGSNEFQGVWLDLDPYLEDYDLSGFSQGAIDGWRMPGQGLIGLAIGVYPSALYINRDLFDQAGLPYPPQSYDDPTYQGEPWTIETMSELAKLLTLDANGNNATSPNFDPDNVVQFGFHIQWTDARGYATFFGGGSFYDEEGNAVIPDHWRAAWEWYYEAMWPGEDGVVFAPNGAYQGSDLLSNGNPFSSGHVAMAHCHTWYTCCLGNVTNWDYAIVPSYNGTFTAKLHTDAVGVLSTTEHPEEAVEVVYAIATNPQLVTVWGAVPALIDIQDEFFAAMDQRFPQGVNWDTVLAGLDHVDVPNHESWMPNFSQADDVIAAFGNALNNQEGLDLDAAIAQLQADLQSVFEAAQ